jgi:hypothetical protein
MGLLSTPKKAETEDLTDLRKILDSCTKYANREQWCASYEYAMNEALEGTKYFVGYNEEMKRRIMVDENTNNENTDLKKVLTAIATAAENHGYESQLKRAISNIQDELSVDINFEKRKQVVFIMPPLLLTPAEDDFVTKEDTWGEGYVTYNDQLQKLVSEGSIEDLLRFVLERGVALRDSHVILDTRTTEKVTVVPKG